MLKKKSSVLCHHTRCVCMCVCHTLLWSQQTVKSIKIQTANRSTRKLCWNSQLTEMTLAICSSYRFERINIYWTEALGTMTKTIKINQKKCDSNKRPYLNWNMTWLRIVVCVYIMYISISQEKQFSSYFIPAIAFCIGCLHSISVQIPNDNLMKCCIKTPESII